MNEFMRCSHLQEDLASKLSENTTSYMPVTKEMLMTSKFNTQQPPGYHRPRAILRQQFSTSSHNFANAGFSRFANMKVSSAF